MRPGRRRAFCEAQAEAQWAVIAHALRDKQPKRAAIRDLTPGGPPLVGQNTAGRQAGGAGAKGLTSRNCPSTSRPACMSSVHSVVHPAIRAAATIIAS